MRDRHQRSQRQRSANNTLVSNGIDVRVRGTAHQIYEKYLALAADALGSGDRVLAEHHQQHAEHYCRVIEAA